jgi:hypothetical protein
LNENVTTRTAKATVRAPRAKKHHRDPRCGLDPPDRQDAKRGEALPARGGEQSRKNCW